MTPFPFDDGIPEEEVVSWEVFYLHRNRAGIPLGLRVEHLRSWLHVATRDKSPDPTHWGEVVVLIQATFHNGHLAEEFT